MPPIADKTARKPAAITTFLDLRTFPTVPEQMVQCFTFYFNNRLCQGICYANELYALADESSSEQRSTAYQRAIELVQQGQIVVLTVSATQYRSWISLRSPDCLHYFF